MAMTSRPFDVFEIRQTRLYTDDCIDGSVSPLLLRFHVFLLANVFFSLPTSLLNNLGPVS